MAGLFLILDDIVFSSLEIPSKIGPLGGKQVLVRHEFPGGLITLQDLGAFPHTLSWSGHFTGSNAFDRAVAVDRKRASAQEVILSYGPQAFSGIVREFEYNPEHQWLIPYRITFEPDADLSGINSNPLASILSAEGLLSLATGAITSLVAATGLAFPASLVASEVALAADISTGLLNGNGTVKGIPSASALAVATDVAAAQLAASLLYGGSDPTQASPALDYNAYATAAGIMTASPTRPHRQIVMVNPNLFTVAATYLGDSNRWPEIAKASSLPPDPQPIGTFTILVPPK